MECPIYRIIKSDNARLFCLGNEVVGFRFSHERLRYRQFPFTGYIRKLDMRAKTVRNETRRSVTVRIVCIVRIVRITRIICIMSVNRPN